MADEATTDLIVLWCLTGGATVLMCARIFLKKYRNQALELGEYFTIAALFSLLLRGSVISVAIIWGTNRLSAAERKGHIFTSEEIYQREIGAKMTIINRCFYAIYIWLQKSVVMCVLQRLLQGLQLRKLIATVWIIIGTTFIGAFVANFVDCTPFNHYYIVVPNPGACSKGISQLIIFSTLNIFTDLILIALPLPQLLRVKRPLMEKLRLVALFTVGFAIVAVSLTRLILNVAVLQRAGASRHIANTEIFFAAVVANATVIYGLINLGKGTKGSTKTHEYLGSRSIGKSQTTDLDGHYTRMGNDAVELGNRKKGAMVVSGISKHNMESDEEMILEPPNRPQMNVRLGSKPAV